MSEENRDGTVVCEPDEPGIAAAATAIQDGNLVVYPTETVYGLGADATNPDAIRRVFAAKQRPRHRPISLAVPNLPAARRYVDVSDRERAFMDTFLPGPVTVVCARRKTVPAVLTGGRDRVGIRIPDHEIAIRLLERVAPLTATSANVSGRPSVRHPDEVEPELREAVSVILDGGRTPGGGSTVVDVTADEIIREGHRANAIAEWLTDH